MKALCKVLYPDGAGAMAASRKMRRSELIERDEPAIDEV
jgi:hypothetical protein